MYLYLKYLCTYASVCVCVCVCEYVGEDRDEVAVLRALGQEEVVAVDLVAAHHSDQWLEAI